MNNFKPLLIGQVVNFTDRKNIIYPAIVTKTYNDTNPERCDLYVISGPHPYLEDLIKDSHDDEVLILYAAAPFFAIYVPYSDLPAPNTWQCLPDL